MITLLFDIVMTIYFVLTELKASIGTIARSLVHFIDVILMGFIKQYKLHHQQPQLEKVPHLVPNTQATLHIPL